MPEARIPGRHNPHRTPNPTIPQHLKPNLRSLPHQATSSSHPPSPPAPTRSYRSPPTPSPTVSYRPSQHTFLSNKPESSKRTPSAPPARAADIPLPLLLPRRRPVKRRIRLARPRLRTSVPSRSGFRRAMAQVAAKAVVWSRGDVGLGRRGTERW